MATGAPRAGAVASPIFALWGRTGIDDAIRSKNVFGFDAHDMLTP